MISVFVWLPKSLALDDVGHASMAIGSKYFSLYPDSSGALSEPNSMIGAKLNEIGGQAVQLAKRKHTIVDSYKEDIEHNRKEADHQVILYNMDEKACLDVWETNVKHYSLLGDNCSAMVLSSLTAGVPKSVGLFNSFKFEAWGDFWITKEIALASFKVLRDIASGKFQSDTLHSLVQINPRRVLELAQQIKSLVG
jgi:hypothetical protein